MSFTSALLYDGQAIELEKTIVSTRLTLNDIFFKNKILELFSFFKSVRGNEFETKGI